MSSDDRAVARACRHLQDAETLLASAVGRELEGRRGRVLLVTDRRVVVTWARPALPDDLSLHACTVEYDAHTRVLTITERGRSVSLRDVDPVSARPVVDRIAGRAAPPVAERIGPPFRVRVLGA